MKISSASRLIIGAVTIGLGVFFASLLFYRSAANQVIDAYENRYRSYLLADTLRQSSDDLTRLVRTYAATGDVQYKDQYNSVLAIRNGKAAQPVDYYRIYWDFVAGGNPTPRPSGETIALKDQMRQAGFTAEEFALLDEAGKRSDGLVNLEVEAMSLVDSKDSSKRLKAIDLVNSSEYHRYKAEIMKPIDDFYVKLEKRLSDNIKNATHTADFYWSAMMIAGAGLVLVLIVLGYFMSYRVVRGITILTGAMVKIASQQLDTQVAGRDRKDEIGDMAGALETFRQAAITNRRLEAEAEQQRERAEAERIQIQKDAEANAQLRLKQATSGLASGLERLASGDLAFQLTEVFSPEFERLRHDFNKATKQLRDTMEIVAQSANSINLGTREISQSSDDLSKRTEQQAAALEETAAALDEITVNVTNSSRRTEEAKQVAAKANVRTTESSAVVGNAVEAMRRIEESSSKISSIIGVIDEIAFQTNLLALNAGVEAARAGEAGKGFAVVAQEVRELAQRSAQAAKEIKDLIRNSTIEVESGVKLVRETGDVLKTIEEYVSTINQHMEAISTAAHEQSAGLAQVNTAVNQMDQVTQRNAAMVEETNAASANLAQEGSNIHDLISRFNLGNDQNVDANASHVQLARSAQHLPYAQRKAG